MTSIISCPICHLDRISSDKAKCPQCDADLTCFKVLESLPNEQVGEKIASRRQVSFLSAMVLFLGLVSALSLFQLYRINGLGFFGFGLQSYPSPTKVTAKSEAKDLAENQLAPAGDSNGRLEISGPSTDEVEALSVPKKASIYAHPLKKGGQGVFEQKTVGNERLQEVPSERQREKGSCSQDTAFWTYTANGNDTLWGIAKRHYGFGHYYPVLLEHNPNVGIYNVEDGVRLRILKYPGLAKKINRSITEREGNKLYFHYSVAEGDTLGSLACKFYKTRGMLKRITDLNNDMKLQPGERVKILLE